MEVLSFLRHFALVVVPPDIPSLAKVKVLHFTKKNLKKCLVVFGSHKLRHFINRSQVHEIASVDCDVSAEFFVRAKISSTHVTLIFEIINH